MSEKVSIFKEIEPIDWLIESHSACCYFTSVSLFLSFYHSFNKTVSEAKSQFFSCFLANCLALYLIYYTLQQKAERFALYLSVEKERDRQGVSESQNEQ